VRKESDQRMYHLKEKEKNKPNLHAIESEEKSCLNHAQRDGESFSGSRVRSLSFSKNIAKREHTTEVDAVLW
jgi:hypothetical protein